MVALFNRQAILSTVRRTTRIHKRKSTPMFNFTLANPRLFTTSAPIDGRLTDKQLEYMVGATLAYLEELGRMPGTSDTTAHVLSGAADAIAILLHQVMIARGQ